MTEAIYGGVDPSAVPDNPTGCAVLRRDGTLLKAGDSFRDEDVLNYFAPYELLGVALDAPRSLPLDMGLCCLEDEPKCPCPPGASRACERDLQSQGYSLFSVNKNTFPAAKQWIRRGLLLYLRFQSLGTPTFEVYPHASKCILFPAVSFPRSKGSRAARTVLQQALAEVIPGMPPAKPTLLSDHALDAILAAYTLYLFKEKSQGELFGDPREGQILLPKMNGYSVTPS